MKLEAIESKTNVFVDANIFIYHFTGASNQCSSLASHDEDFARIEWVDLYRPEDVRI